MNRSSADVPCLIRVYEGELDVVADTGNPVLDRYLEANLDSLKHDFSHKGWRRVDIVHYSSIAADLLEKGDLQVYYVNEEWSDDLDFERSCFFADDRSALEQFCDDWGFDKEMIEDKGTVYQYF